MSKKGRRDRLLLLFYARECMGPLWLNVSGLLPSWVSEFERTVHSLQKHLQRVHNRYLGAPRRNKQTMMMVLLDWREAAANA